MTTGMHRRCIGCSRLLRRRQLILIALNNGSLRQNRDFLLLQSGSSLRRASETTARARPVRCRKRHPPQRTSDGNVVEVAGSELAGDEPVLREATSADLEFMTRMLFDAWQWNPEHAGPHFTAWREQNPRDKYVSDFGDRAGDGGVIAEVGGVPVGAAWRRLMRREEGAAGFVASDVPEVVIAVAADHRGRGIGRMLMQELLAQAQRAGVFALSLRVDLDNTRARHLYLAQGFVDHHRTDTGIVMVRR
jgi:ribosomal protein S18 acetylase RimI-like enzyme